MQLTNILALFALTAVAAAAPAHGNGVVLTPIVVSKPAPPKVNPPVINKNSGTITVRCPNRQVLLILLIDPSQNTCQSGPAYCCSPTGATNSGDMSSGDSKAGTTCVAGASTCNTVSICCNNLQQGTAPSVSISWIVSSTSPSLCGMWHRPTRSGPILHCGDRYEPLSSMATSVTMPTLSMIVSNPNALEPPSSPSSVLSTVADSASPPSRLRTADLPPSLLSPLFSSCKARSRLTVFFTALVALVV